MIDRDILYLLRDLRRRAAGNVSLEALARRAGWSPFHLHRAFRRVVRETPKQYMQRVRLDVAAARLVATRDKIAEIAAAAGFASHEVFTRAFRRRFERSPAEYRAAALAGASTDERERHSALIAEVTPCIGLHYITTRLGRNTMPMLTIDREELAAQPIVFVRRRCARAELPQAIGECLASAFGFAQKAGHAIGGRPFVRYASVGAGLLTIEAGCPLAVAASGEGEIEAGWLPGGPAAVAMHAGPYEDLPATHAAMERWIEAQGYRAGGSPWESYITDPADFPDTADWRTAVYWPLAE
jgi:AraC family transcriptional regulator